MPAQVLSIETPEGALRMASAGIADNFGRWLRFIGHTDGSAIELQVVDIPTNYGGVFSRFAYARTLAEAVRLLEESEKWKTAPAAYTVVNDIDPAVATRAVGAKWHTAKKGHATSNLDIAARCVVYVDVDAKRVRDVTATNEEVARAAEVGARVYAKLAELVGTDAIGYGHSGNGRSVFVALDHIAESPELERTVKGILVALGAMFATPRVVIDPVVSEAKRLGPAWGTTKRKGAEGFADRPHRRTAFVCAEETRRLNYAGLRDLLEKLRDELPDEKRGEVDKAMGIRSPAHSAVMPRTEGGGAFTRANAVEIERVAEWLGLVDSGGVRCPGCGAHGNSSIAFVGNGLKCLHATCATKGKENGFRTPVDLVAEVHGISPSAAVERMAVHFQFEGFPVKSQTNGIHVPTPEEARAAAESYEAEERAAILEDDTAPVSEPSAPKKPTKPAKPAPKPSWKTPAERALLLGDKGTRIPLGIETLDKACRGGLLTGKVVIIGGAPGAGKTTLATQKALELAQAGVHVAILAADEDADGLLIRIGQNLNLAREDLEGGIDEAKRYLSESVAPLPLMLFDSDDDAVTIEMASAELTKRAGGAPSALFIDSIQTARSNKSELAETTRQRTDEIMRAIKMAAKQGHLVIALSEVSRGWYRNASDRIDPLAAFKESGGIEYGAAVALAMMNVKGEDELVDVVIAKNRLGQKPPFRMRLNFDRARLGEVEIDDNEALEDEDKREAMRIEKARARILATLAIVSTLGTKNAVCIRARGKRKDNLKAFDELLLEGLIVQVGGYFRPSLPPSEGGPR